MTSDSYETKVIFKLVAAVIRLADSREKAHDIIADAANVDGVIIEPLLQNLINESEKKDA